VIELNRRFTRHNLSMTIVSRNLGNELRSAPPNSADIVLTRDLGYATTRYILDGGNNCMITLKNEKCFAIPLSDMVDHSISRSVVGSTRIRTVDTTALSYQVALNYMIMLKQSDLQDPNFLPKLAKAANIPAQDFIKQFAPVALPTSATTNLGLRPQNFPQQEEINGNLVDNTSPGITNYIHEYTTRGNVDSGSARGFHTSTGSPTQTPRPMTPEPRDANAVKEEKQQTVPLHHISHQPS
jgi:hypothetical protein